MSVSFSVIISVFNKEKYIKATIESVLKQSFKDFELIVVNDGSTDNSLGIIEEFKDKRLRIISTKNQGASLCRNTGIKAASNTFIALLDGDDLWDADYLKKVQDCIISFPNESVFATAVAHKYKDKIVAATYNFKQEKTYAVRNFFESSLDHTIITSSSVVFKNEILKKTGYFDTSIVSGQDTDLWIRIGLNYKVVFINEVLAYYNYVPESLSNTVFSVKNKPKYDKYFELEKSNKNLKLYLDRNRFPLAILSKLEKNTERFKFYSSHINPKNLRPEQRIILFAPRWIVRLLLKLKSLNGEKLYYPVT
jgi:glycosyltransferase involved in cell wall biosynthesis